MKYQVKLGDSVVIVGEDGGKRVVSVIEIERWLNERRRVAGVEEPVVPVSFEPAPVSGAKNTEVVKDQDASERDTPTEG